MNYQPIVTHISGLLWVLAVIGASAPTAASQDSAVRAVSSALESEKPSERNGSTQSGEKSIVQSWTSIIQSWLKSQSAAKAKPKGPEVKKSTMSDVLETKKKLHHRYDPFATAETMRRLATDRQDANRPITSPAISTVAIPAIHLKGVADDGVQQRIALIEVESLGVVVVRAGDVLNVTSDGQIVVLAVREIVNTVVIVHVQNTGQDILVR